MAEFVVMPVLAKLLEGANTSAVFSEPRHRSVRARRASASRQ